MALLTDIVLFLDGEGTRFSYLLHVSTALRVRMCIQRQYARYAALPGLCASVRVRVCLDDRFLAYLNTFRACLRKFSVRWHKEHVVDR
jgi:hypothetical protein